MQVALQLRPPPPHCPLVKAGSEDAQTQCPQSPAHRVEDMGAFQDKGHPLADVASGQIGDRPGENGRRVFEQDDLQSIVAAQVRTPVRHPREPKWLKAPVLNLPGPPVRHIPQRVVGREPAHGQAPQYATAEGDAAFHEGKNEEQDGPQPDVNFLHGKPLAV